MGNGKVYKANDDEGRYTQYYGVPLQLEDNVLIPTPRVMIKIGGQQQGLPKAIEDLSSKATPLSSGGGIRRQNFITQLEGTFPSWKGSWGGRGHNGTNYGGLTNGPCLLGGFHRVVESLLRPKPKWRAGRQEGY